MNSICQTSNGSLSNSRCLGGVQTGFSGFYFGQMGQEGRYFLWSYSYFPTSVGSWMLCFCQCQAVLRGFVAKERKRGAELKLVNVKGLCEEQSAKGFHMR